MKIFQLLLFFSISLTSANAGEIYGRVKVMVPEGQQWGMDTSFGDIVLYLEGPKKRVQTPDPLKIEVLEGKFSKRVVPVQAGTKVIFESDLPRKLDIYSRSKAKTFTLTDIFELRKGSVILDQPGIVPVYCNQDPNMLITFYVLNHDNFTVSDGSGFYKFENIPIGKHKLVAWGDGAKAIRRPVVVPKPSSKVRVDLTVQRRPKERAHFNIHGKRIKKLD